MWSSNRSRTENKGLTMLNRQTHDRRSKGFTLIELMLVMVIIAILAAVVVPKFTGQRERANQTKAKADIATLKNALSMFEVDNSRFPTTDEGLRALVEKPQGLDTWKHAYIDALQKDPWDQDYIYRSPGN